MTPEQKQRIEQIEKRNKCGDYDLDIDFLLSLVKSQEAGIWANEIKLRLERSRDLKADTGSVKDQAFIDGGRAALERLLEDIEEDYTPERNDAATSMRSRCVEKVKAMAEKWHRDGSLLRTMSLTIKAQAANEIITALESVSIEASATEKEGMNG